jgi:hypothetical protein
MEDVINKLIIYSGGGGGGSSGGSDSEDDDDEGYDHKLMKQMLVKTILKMMKTRIILFNQLKAMIKKVRWKICHILVYCLTKLYIGITYCSL